MAHFISVGGKCYPAREFHVNSNVTPENRDQAIYDGPDRDAMTILKQEGREWIGEDYRSNMDLKRAANAAGFGNDVDRYVKEFIGVDPKKAIKKQEELRDVIHQNGTPQPRKNSTRQPSGGDDTSGSGKSRKGGFGEPDDVPSGDLKARAAG